jgi:U3 small nucleolar RNA-associated protein 15
VVKNYKYFNRGQYLKEIDEKSKQLITSKQIMKKRNNKLKVYDKMLKSFQYQNALNSVLNSQNVEDIISVIEELITRNALKLSLLNRTEEEVKVILKFIEKKINDPRICNILIHLFDLIVEYYSKVFGMNIEIDNLFDSINKKIEEEIKNQEEFTNIHNDLEDLLTHNFISL